MTPGLMVEERVTFRMKAPFTDAGRSPLMCSMKCSTFAFRSADANERSPDSGS